MPYKFCLPLFNVVFDVSTGVRGFLKERGILGLEGDELLVSVVQSVAAIPFGEGRTVEEVLKTRRVGTCTGKHLLLAACLDELGFRCRPVVCAFRWGDQKIAYPENLRRILGEGEWEHGHNFLQVLVDKNYVDVDVTWNPHLKPYGFRTFPLDWDGRTPFVGLDKMLWRRDGGDIGELKGFLVGSLERRVFERRARFLKAFFAWTSSVNKPPNL